MTSARGTTLTDPSTSGSKSLSLATAPATSLFAFSVARPGSPRWGQLHWSRMFACS